MRVLLWMHVYTVAVVVFSILRVLTEDRLCMGMSSSSSFMSNPSLP